MTNLNHKVINIDDQPTENIKKYFIEMIDFIDDNLKKNINVLVHCFAGVSRSASAVIAYLMKVNQMDFKSAYNFCK